MTTSLKKSLNFRQVREILEKSFNFISNFGRSLKGPWILKLILEILEFRAQYNLPHTFAQIGAAMRHTSYYILLLYIFFTSRVSGRGYKNGSVCGCVCVSVCVCVNTLMAELFDIWSPNLVQGLTLIISWTSLILRVIGQRSRSPSQKILFPGFFSVEWRDTKPWLMVWCHGIIVWRHDVMWHCGMTSRRHLTSQNDVNTPTREVQQHFSVFFWHVIAFSSGFLLGRHIVIPGHWNLGPSNLLTMKRQWTYGLT